MSDVGFAGVGRRCSAIAIVFVAGCTSEGGVTEKEIFLLRSELEGSSIRLHGRVTSCWRATSSSSSARYEA